MTVRTLMGPGGATAAKQDIIIATLTSTLTELSQKLEPGQEVALSAATLAALESITAVVSGTVALDVPTLAALEQVTSTINNFPADYPDVSTLAKLEQVRTLLAGTLQVAGTVGVNNFPADQKVHDDLATEGHAVDQEGANAVLTFNVTAGHLVMVDVDPVAANDTLNYRARATCNGSTPTAISGFVCRPGTSYLPLPTAGTVKVWAPTGVIVAVQVLAR